MDDWTQKSIEGFDLLTVIAMVEACEPDLTMVRYINLVTAVQKVVPDNLPRVATTQVQVTCLQCAMDSWQRFNKQDPRVALIESARNNAVVVLDIRLRFEGELCRKCQAPLMPLGVGSDEEGFLCVRQK